jgi:signal transduction histidine kinase/HD-like signal output (HDOD) protein
MIVKETVYAQVEKSGNLPTLPEILLKLIDACDSEATPLTEIASIISKDPALSFKVLELVNSAYFGFQRTFTGVDQGVIYLGANSIKNIAVTTSIHQVFNRNRFKAVKHFNFGAFWYHSLLSATLAKRLASKTGFSSVDEAYLSGLLLDIGRLVLLSTFPKEHELILLETKHKQNELWAETQLIGVNHCEAGSWLVNKWKLNSLMADAIKYHHEPLEQVKEAFPLVKIAYVSSLLSENKLGQESINEAANLLLGLDSGDLRIIVEGANEEVLQIAENLAISVKRPASHGEGLHSKKMQPSGDKGALAEDPVEDLATAEDPDYSDRKGQARLTERIKNISLLSGVLESLIQADDTENIIEVFEQSMRILFSVEKVLFFLPEKDGILLKGRTSAANNLLHLSQGLTLPVQRSSSLIAQAYLSHSLTHLKTDGRHENLADEQVLSTLRCSTVLIVPFQADKEPAGVILLGLPDSVTLFPAGDCKLIEMIARQVGQSLLLEKMKARKAEEIEAERMAAVSMAARKFAHEINNPLGIITNYLTTISLKLSKDSAIQQELGIVSEEINRISSLVNQMDNFSKTPFLKFELTDITEVIEDLIQILKPSLLVDGRITLVFEPDPLLPQIETSRDGLKQILINLLKNASEAMEEGGSIEIKTNKILKNVHGSGVPPADGVEIVVEDDGPGLPESITKNLYKPFVTTKKSGHSGLGLSIVQKAVKDLGGSISCESRPAGGTSFSIYLPLKK